ncbi:fork-head transcriptional regulator FHL1 [Drosophila mojavensis]|uniref:Uncharacterized protein n=1 Tax=Drosophila mojavensis TaxID=7230 RepID=B4KHA2_DROMO|nr:fork-head transcriptional regulator FHL1 [Drosophila mojavensis]EDW13319.1 uncharacterized protein Dmoj_GI20639 [Drosophila mojavensis]
MQTASSNTAAAAAGAGGEPTAAPLRACSTSGCRVSKYVEVTKRKCSQFVSAPYIMPKPLVVNGKTSIFQVGGEMAKMGDIPSLAAAAGSGEGQPIYRIKPGTHAHVINYVFIDEGSDSMEKAKSEDQEAMRMLLDSQRESATAKLQKLLSTHRGLALLSAATPTTAPDAATATVGPAVPPSGVANNVHVTTPQIHPNLSIASVEGAALPFAPTAVPSITPISTATPTPTAASVPVPAPAAVAAAPPPKSKPMDTSVDQLQAEILKLRRTVARLGGGCVPK